MELKQLFNYDTINDTHKEAAQEIVDLLKTCGAELQAELISKKFNLVEPIRYDLSDSKFLTLLKNNGLSVLIQGYCKDGDNYEFPIVSVIADVRVWNEFLEKYESNKISK